MLFCQEFSVIVLKSIVFILSIKLARLFVEPITVFIIAPYLICIPRHHLPSWWNYYIWASLLVKPYSFVVIFVTLYWCFYLAQLSVGAVMFPQHFWRYFSLVLWLQWELHYLLSLSSQICLVSLREFKRFSLTLIFSIFGTVWITFLLAAQCLRSYFTFSSNVHLWHAPFITPTHIYVCTGQNKWLPKVMEEDLELQTPEHSHVELNSPG